MRKDSFSKSNLVMAKEKVVFIDRDIVIKIDSERKYKKRIVFTDFIYGLCNKYQKLGNSIIIFAKYAESKKEKQQIKFIIKELKNKGIDISKFLFISKEAKYGKNIVYASFENIIIDLNFDANECVVVSNKLSNLEEAHNAGISNLYYYQSKDEEYLAKFDYKHLDTENLNFKNNIVHLMFNYYDMNQTVSKIEKFIKNKSQSIIVPVNLDMLRLSYKDQIFKSIINDSDVSLIDGKPLIWLSKIYHKEFKYKISGSDLIYPVLDMCNKNSYRIFIVGGIGEVPSIAKNNILKKYKNIGEVDFFSPPFGFEKDELETKKVIDKINRFNPDLVLLCLGAPKQEKFWNNNRNLLCNATYLCAGATVDFLANKIKRSPKWMSNHGLEWFYRLIKEPRRMFKRYWLDFWFLFKIIFLNLFNRKSK